MSKTIKGSAGVSDHVPGAPTTMSGVAEVSGGVAAGNLIEVDVDEELFAIESEETPLMGLMLKSKKVKVKSPEVDHYMIDSPRAMITLTQEVPAQTAMQFVLPLDSRDQNLARPYTTLLVKDVDGYDESGRNVTVGQSLMLFVVAHDPTSNCPVVRAVNGRKQNADDEYSTCPLIPYGSKIVILANSLYETQKEVDPDLIVPQPRRVYLQKRGMNQVVSDYFDSVKKRIPFSQALIAEQAILDFKRRGNRTLWAGRAGKFKLNIPKMGMQYVYTTEGVRWQFKRELMHKGRWTIEDLIAMAKMFFTGEDAAKSGILLCGKNLLEQLQCIDYTKHPEITIKGVQNTVGWSVTRIHTVFGDIDLKREPTLDKLGWSNSGALIGENRLVHYTFSEEHEFSDRVEGEEASRKGILVWDALALKGMCHIWIDGDDGRSSSGAVGIKLWSKAEAPTDADYGDVYYLTEDCPGMSAKALSGQLWEAYKGVTDMGVPGLRFRLYTVEMAGD